MDLPLCHEDISPSKGHLQCLKDVFNLPSFRGQQYAAISATLHSKDSICVLPTGAGKVSWPRGDVCSPQRVFMCVSEQFILLS